MSKKKVILYCRVAVYDQSEDVLGSQVKFLKDYAKLQDYEIVEVIKESTGGIDWTRPGISRIYDIVDSRDDVDAVLAKNLIRYGRGPVTEIINFIENLNGKGVKVLTVENGDLQNALPILKAEL